MGVRRVTSLAPSAFLASAASTDVLQQQLLLHSPRVATTDTAVSLAKNIWSSAVQNSPLPAGLSAHKQSAWDKSVIASERLELNNSLSNPADQVRQATSPHSGDWLHALQLSGCGLGLDDRAVHIAAGLRLGANICEPHQCPYGATVDAKGLHGRSWKRGSGRSARHRGSNDLIWRALTKADIPATKEPSVLLRTDGKRPDGVTLLR